MNKVKTEIDAWLQMNFPVGAGPEIVIGDDLLPSPHHYMAIQFGSDIEGAHFIIMETPEDNNGLRSSHDMAVASFTMPKDLLLKIVRVIAANEDRFPLHNHTDLAEW